MTTHCIIIKISNYDSVLATYKEMDYSGRDVAYCKTTLWFSYRLLDTVTTKDQTYCSVARTNL